MRLRAATSADFGAIRAIAQLPEQAHLITDEDEAALASYVADPHSRLFMVQTAGDAQAGFALFCQLDSPARAVELRRLALRDIGGGQGKAFVRFLTAYAFDHLGAARVWLDTGADNLRAQRCYESAGYILEGRMRQQGYCAPLRQPVDELLYGILRREWDAR